MHRSCQACTVGARPAQSGSDPGCADRGRSRSQLTGWLRGLSYHGADGRARQEETRPARAAARHGARRRRLGSARVGAALVRGRAPRHGLVLRARRRTRPRTPRSSRASRRNRRSPGRAGASTPAHQRQNPQAQQRPPFTQVWGAGLDSLAEFPPVADDKGVYIETASGGVVALNPRTGRRRWTRQVAPAARDQPCARRAPALRLLAGRRRARAAPQRRQARLALPGGRAHRVLAPARRRHALLRRRGRHADRARRQERAPCAGACTSAAPSRARPPTAAGCWSSAPTTATSTASTPARARAAGAPPGSAATAGCSRATSTPRPRSPTAASTSARPTAACTRSSPRRARSPGRAQTGGYVYAGPAVVHQLVLIGSYDGWFYAFNARTGARRWSFDAKARISGSATRRQRHRLLLDVRQRHVRARRSQRPAGLAALRGTLLAGRRDTRRVLLRRLQHAAAATTAHPPGRPLPALRRQRHRTRRACSPPAF